MASTSFTGSDENPLSEGGTWATGPTWSGLRRVSNTVASVSGGGSSLSYRTDSTVLLSQCVVSTNPTVGDGGPVVCYNSSTNEGYFFGNSASFQLYIWELPSFNIAANVGGANFASNDVLKLTREGNDVVGYVNGVEVIRATAETSFMTGAPGIFMFDGDLRLDDWTDGAAGGTGLTVPRNIALIAAINRASNF